MHVTVQRFDGNKIEFTGINDYEIYNTDFLLQPDEKFDRASETITDALLAAVQTGSWPEKVRPTVELWPYSSSLADSSESATGGSLDVSGIVTEVFDTETNIQYQGHDSSTLVYHTRTNIETAYENILWHLLLPDTEAYVLVHDGSLIERKLDHIFDYDELRSEVSQRDNRDNLSWVDITQTTHIIGYEFPQRRPELSLSVEALYDRFTPEW